MPTTSATFLLATPKLHIFRESAIIPIFGFERDATILVSRVDPEEKEHSEQGRIILETRCPSFIEVTLFCWEWYRMKSLSEFEAKGVPASEASE